MFWLPGFAVDGVKQILQDGTWQSGRPTDQRRNPNRPVTNCLYTVGYVAIPAET